VSPAAGKMLDLTTEIRAAHQAVIGSIKNGFYEAIRCGELLTEMKDEAGHGGWLPWLKANPWISPRTASDYMRLAAAFTTDDAKSAAAADLTIRSALRLLSPPKSQPTARSPASVSTGSSSPPSEKRVQAALVAMHDCEPSERRRIFADPGIHESIQPQQRPNPLPFPPPVRATPEKQTDAESAAAEEFFAIIMRLPREDLSRFMKLASEFTLIFGPEESWGNRPKYCAISGDLMKGWFR
jgi:hypothetical protein